MVKKKEEVVLGGETKPFYDKILKSSVFVNLISGKDKVRVATALVYERIGDTEYFLGGFPLLRGVYHQIGEYFVLDKPGKPYFIDCLGSDVFIPCKDRKLDKIVEMVKFSEDDYRVRTKLNKKFYCVDKKIVYEDKPVVLCDEHNNPVIGDDGEEVFVRIPKKDELGNVVFEEVKKVYVEPLGVTQEGRDSIRIHNQTSEEIKKFKEKNEGFWSRFSRHGGTAVVGLAIVAMLFLMGMKYISDSWSEGVNVLSDDIKSASEDIKWWQQPDALDKISGAVQEKSDEKNAPKIT